MQNLRLLFLPIYLGGLPTFGCAAENTTNLPPTDYVTVSTALSEELSWSVGSNGAADQFITILQTYTAPSPSLDFGLPSVWESIEGDFDNDGRGDYARLGGTGAWLFYSNGDGTFTRGFQNYVDQAPPLDFGWPSEWTTVVGDFDGDGTTDHARLGATGAWLFLGEESRGFTRGFQSYVDQAPPLDFGLPSVWESISGDFDNDGRDDYARLGGTGAWLFYSNGDGTFTRGFQSYVDQAPPLDFGWPSAWTTTVGDFNGDGTTDYARLGATGAWLFFGKEGRGFTRGFQSYVDQAPALDFGLPSTWQSIGGDFNGDGNADYARLGGTGAWVFFGDVDGTFDRSFQSYVDQEPPLDFGENSAWQSIAGDFNGDGRGDYARLGSTGAWLYHGRADGTFRREFQNYNGRAFGEPSPFQVVTGDFRGTGRTSYARLGGTEAYVFLHR